MCNSLCLYSLMETVCSKTLTLINPNLLDNLLKSKLENLNFIFQNRLSSQNANKGTIFLTGVSELGNLAQKVSQNIVSIGTQSEFLSPCDHSLDGFMNKFSKSDLLVLFSKSGDEEQLLKLVCCAKAKDILSISVTLGESNLLKFLCDLNVHLPLEKETTCSLNLDLVNQMVFCDSMANSLRNLRNNPALGIANSAIIKESISPTSEGCALIPRGGNMDQCGSGFGSVRDANPVTEDEIMAVLLQKNMVTTQYIVATFKPRVKSSQAKNAFAETLKRIARIQRTGGSCFLVPRENLLAEKQNLAPEEGPIGNSPSIRTEGSAQVMLLTSTSVNAKRKSDSEGVKASFGALAKKIKTEMPSKSSGKDGFPLAVSVCPVTEDEIRAVLLQKFPVTINDLSAKFTARLKSSKAKEAFADLIKKISKLRKTNGSTFVILRET